MEADSFLGLDVLYNVRLKDFRPPLPAEEPGVALYAYTTKQPPQLDYDEQMQLMVDIEKTVRGHLDEVRAPRFDDLHMTIFDPDATNCARGDRTGLATFSSAAYVTEPLIERIQSKLLGEHQLWRISIDFETLPGDHVIIYPRHYHLLCGGTKLPTNAPFDVWAEAVGRHRRETHGAQWRQLRWLERQLPALLPTTEGRKATCLAVFDNREGDVDRLCVWGCLRCKIWRVTFSDECAADDRNTYYIYDDHDFANAPLDKSDFSAPPLYLASWSIDRPQDGRVTVLDAGDKNTVLAQVEIDQLLVRDTDLQRQFPWDNDL
jgi:hypothetical protein